MERFICKLPQCPIFYQHFTAKLMEHIIKLQVPVVTETSCESHPTELSYEEQNAVRYVAGYVIKSLKQHLKSPRDDELISSLKDLCNTDDDIEPAETEEWLCSVDRGGLVRITDDAYACFSAIEYCVQQQFQTSKLHKVNHGFREEVTKLTLTMMFSFTGVFFLETWTKSQRINS